MCNLQEMHAIHRHTTLSRRPLIARDAEEHMSREEEREGVSDVSRMQAYGSWLGKTNAGFTRVELVNGEQSLGLLALHDFGLPVETLVLFYLRDSSHVLHNQLLFPSPPAVV